MKKILLCILFAHISTLGFSQVPSYVPANGLVGYWPFNGNANDVSGNGNNGTVNGATLTNDRNGVANSAYSFDGVDDNIHVGQFNLTSDYSVSFWIFLNNSDFQYPIGFGINQFNTVDIYKGYGIGYSSTVPPCPGLGSSKYFVNDAVSTCNTWIECNSQSSPNQWNHIVVQKNGNLVSLYIDGVIDNSGNNLNLQGIIDLYFGVRSDLFAYFDGTLDDIGIWNRALTECEIQNLYTSTNPSNTTTATACGSYVWNGQTYSASGVYTDISNCVTESLNLTINQSTSSSISQTALDSYTWPVNNQTYTTTGAYTAVIPNAAGCDSTITLNLTMSFTGINDLSDSKLTIYPNPTNGDFTITGLELVGSVSSLSLTDMNDKVVKVLDTKATKFTMASIKPGVYFLNIRAGNKEEVLKIVKE